MNAKELLPGSRASPLSTALLALTFVTGLVDAASFLGLGHIFTSVLPTFAGAAIEAILLLRGAGVGVAVDRFRLDGLLGRSPWVTSATIPPRDLGCP